MGPSGPGDLWDGRLLIVLASSSSVMGVFNESTSDLVSLGSVMSNINASKAVWSNGGWRLGVRQL